MARTPRIAPHGAWPSPVGLDLVAAESGSVSWPGAAGEETWWCASDPASATVRLLRALRSAAPHDVLGAGWSVRNRSLGYGGRPYLVLAGRPHVLVFTEHGDQRLYRADITVLDAAYPDVAGPPVTPWPLTPPDPPEFATCYADPVPAPDGSEVWCVREITRGAAGPNDDPAPRTRRDIVAVPLDGSAAANPAALRVLARSHHFLSGVRASPDGRRLAWIGWDHPAMPWDSTELMVADLVPGPDAAPVAGAAVRVLGGGAVSVPQAEWAGPHALYAMADPDGWWNLHRVELTPSGQPARATCVLPMARECAGALWRVGPSWFGVSSAGVVLHHGVGDQQLALWDPVTGTLRELAPGWTEFGPDMWVGAQAAVVVAGSARESRTVLRVPLAGAAAGAAGAAPVVRAAPAPRHLISPWGVAPQRRTARRTSDGRDVHYVFYPPTSPEYTGPRGELPPLLVHAHGGPTNSTGAAPDREFDLFCSRGFAVASVDYGGSTGYGREYRERLRHSWGVVDVEDSVTVARELAAAGLADPARTAVRGGSAGGWTALACLAFTDIFCAGAVYYPISDPLHWSGGYTHDFESRYLEGLIGSLPRDRARYDAVSPVGNAHRIAVPLVMLQGAEDFICLPEQAQCIVDAVAARGLWHRYLVFPGEGHGFRKQSSVRASLLAEAELYRHAMGIAVDLDPAVPAGAGADELRVGDLPATPDP